MLENANFGDMFITENGIRAVYIRKYDASKQHFVFLENAVVAYVYDSNGILDSQYGLGDEYNLKKS